MTILERSFPLAAWNGIYLSPSDESDTSKDERERASGDWIRSLVACFGMLWCGKCHS